MQDLIEQHAKTYNQYAEILSKHQGSLEGLHHQIDSLKTVRDPRDQTAGMIEELQPETTTPSSPPPQYASNVITMSA